MKNDYLVRAMVLEKLEIALKDVAKNDHEDYIVAKAIQTVRDTPCISAKPVKYGRWVNTHDRLVKCSLCGASVQTNWRGNYCQNCGADMNGGKVYEPDK